MEISNIVEIKPIGQIKSNPNNPRVIKDDKFKKLVASIKDLPQMLELRPIVCNSDGVVLGGNMRLKACKEAGLKEVPVIYASNLTEDQQREFIIKDNVGFGEWDWEMIANEWDTEELTNWGLDIPDFAVRNLEAEEDDFEIPEEVTTDIVLGDLFEIGVHRLLCGDSIDSDQVAKLMNGQKADMVFTDPPYGINYSDEQTGRNRIMGKNSKSEKHRKIENDALNDDHLIKFFYDIFTTIEMFSKEDSCAYVCYADSKAYEIFSALKQSGIKYGQNLIWKKQSLNISFHKYQYIHEPILFIGKSSSVKPYGLWNGNSNDTTVLEFDKVTKNIVHPTMKPIELISKLITNSSNKEMCILDLFLGSGSTMVAAHQLNRKCHGMELDPKYCQVIIDRMKKLDPTLKIKRNGEPYGN